MVKHLLKLTFCSLFLVVPTIGTAQNYGIESGSGFEMVETVKITVQGRSVRIQQAEGKFLEIYSVTGAKVRTVKITSEDYKFSLDLTRGCYIVKVGEVARKISLL